MGICTYLAQRYTSLDLQDHHDPDASGKQISYYSALSLLRGKVYDALENHGRAVKWYQAALKADPFCYEAFQVISSVHSSVFSANHWLNGKIPVAMMVIPYASHGTQHQDCAADFD